MKKKYVYLKEKFLGKYTYYGVWTGVKLCGMEMGNKNERPTVTTIYIKDLVQFIRGARI